MLGYNMEQIPDVEGFCYDSVRYLVTLNQNLISIPIYVRVVLEFLMISVIEVDLD